MTLADLVGSFAALCSMVSFTPQIAKIVATRDASAVSLRTYGVTVTGFVGWVAYGVLIDSRPVVTSNAVCLALSGVILVLKLKFDRAGSAAHAA